MLIVAERWNLISIIIVSDVILGALGKLKFGTRILKLILTTVLEQTIKSQIQFVSAKFIMNWQSGFPI